jgi:hypothetical protein
MPHALMVAVIAVNDAVPLRYRNCCPSGVSPELLHLQVKLAAQLPYRQAAAPRKARTRCRRGTEGDAADLFGELPQFGRTAFPLLFRANPLKSVLGFRPNRPRLSSCP